MIPIPIFDYDQNAGLNNYNKPFLQPEQAFTTLENAYVYRGRVKKREGIQVLGRLARYLTGQALGNTPVAVSNLTITNLFNTLGITGENPEVFPDSNPPFKITIAAPDTATFTDNGDGTLAVTGIGAAGSYIEYATGKVYLNFSVPTTGGAAITLDLGYYPGLPIMGIETQETANINNETTLWFDTKYCYIHNGSTFTENTYTPAVTWNGTDADFFWSTNYRGSDPSIRLFFITNFVNTAANPIRYNDGANWADFKPAVDATNFLVQAKILIPYYGRLLALNVWEGTDYTPTFSKNIYNRCRFSQLGDPTAADAWRSDQFGKGGFIDAPTNEAIISAIFFKNTLIVFFEKTTWQLRYVGEYGLPFIWERISSDFGSESKLSCILFDDGVAAVGNRAIISANSVNVSRIDLKIPNQVFGFKNSSSGFERVIGIRDYGKELVFWTYVDGNTGTKFPNRVLVYNYRNQSYAIFRDSITMFGTFQPPTGITWDSLTTYWNQENVTWDDDFIQAETEAIVSGNQQGFSHGYMYFFSSIVTSDNYLGNDTLEDPSLSITAIDISGPIQITVKNHNLEDLDIIYITNLMFIDSTTHLPIANTINDNIYQVQVIDVDTLLLGKWSTADNTYITNFTYTPTSGAIYVGGGLIALFPKLNVSTKDFNPFQQKGMQLKLSYIDFLMDNSPSSFDVNLYINSSIAFRGNMIIGNSPVETNLPSPYYVNNSEYAWHRFFATLVGQYIRVSMTYNDPLMNTLNTHKYNWELNAMILYTRMGGKLNF